MHELTLSEFSERVEEQLPLMYISSALFIIGMVILFIVILDMLFSIKKLSMRDKKLLFILSVILLSLISGIAIFFGVIIRMAN